MEEMTQRKPDSAMPSGEPASAVRSPCQDPGRKPSLGLLQEARSSGQWPRAERKREREQRPWLGRWGGWGQKGWKCGRGKQGDPSGPKRRSWPQGSKNRPVGVRTPVVVKKWG